MWWSGFLPLNEMHEIVRKLEDARNYVIAMLENAGYGLRDGTRAPLLKMNWRDTGHQHRRDMARRLSLDHLNPKDDFPWLATKPENLRFMLQDDNAARGKSFNHEDKRLRPARKKSSRKEREIRHRARSKVEKSLEMKGIWYKRKTVSAE
jgi:hypothetical protein